MNLYIVTGTTHGLGRALAEAIAKDADNELVGLARGASALARAAHFPVDLADAAALERACDAVAARIRDRRYAKAVLVNNAGVVAPVGPLAALDGPALARNLAVNLVAPMLLMRRFLAMTEGVAPLRRIVNISSGAGRRPVRGWSAYCAAKAGLDMASRVAALESEGTGVEVASLAPGVVDTGMQAAIRETPQARFADVERFRRLKAEGALRSPREVAERILALEAAGRLARGVVLDLRELG